MAVLALSSMFSVETFADDESLRIGSIEIIANDVFTHEEALAGAAYGITNTLHISTRERVIRKFLLFQEGDEYVPSRIEETERILRSQHFLHYASVTASEPHDGVVDILVVTQDSWSTQPGGKVGSAGGATDYGFAIEETNFLGLGKQVTMLYESGVERTGYGVRYEDPAFINPHWTANMLLMSNSDGTQLDLAVERPFYAFATPWSVSAGAADRQFTSRVYSNGEIVGEFDQVHRGFTAAYGVALAPNDSRANRVSFGLDWQSDEFLPIAVGADVPMPDNREYRYLFVGYEFAKNEFEKVHFLDLDERYEDLRTGARYSVRLGVSPSFLGVDGTTGKIEASASHGFDVGSSIVLADLSVDSRLGAARSNSVVTGQLKVIRQYESVHPQTTVGRIWATYGRDLDPDHQLFVDGSTGLRAYRLYSFAGDSSLMLNLEHRIYLGREIWKFISPGVAFFVDAGNAAYGSDAFNPGNLKFDAGFGLRLGMTRTTKNVFRLDFAYAFDSDPFGRQGWLVSFSGGQAF